MIKWISKAQALTLFSTLMSVSFSGAASTIVTTTDAQTTDSTAEETLFKQCFPYVPDVKPPITDPEEAKMMTLLSDKVMASQDNKATFSGNVSFTQGNRELSADEVTLYKQTNILTAEGNVVLADSNSTIKGKTLKANVDTKDAELSQVNYLLNGQAANGEAKKIYITDSGDNILMQRSTYSECPIGDNSWVLKASAIDLDSVEEYAEAYNATLYFKDVPIFYVPYFTYPISDRRRSGLLFPSFSNSLENGFTYSQPIYWNIAPNYDMEIIPTYMSERGLELTTKFRYLVGGQSGNINVEYLNNDKITNTDRSLYHWRHSGNFNERLSLNAQYTQVSDDNYFEDLDASAGARDSNTLLQTGSLNYRTEHTASEFEIRGFQILNDYTVTPHEVMPKISFQGFEQFDSSAIELSFYSEITNFRHNDDEMYSGIRSHIEPGISFPYQRPGGFAVAEFKLPMTYYNQSFDDAVNGNFKNGYKGKLDENVTRVIPTFNLSAGLNFERASNWFGNNYTQTLEPQIQYLYIPYKDQNNIGIYDSASMQQDFMGLFRDRRFSGLDRIADTNQITLGLTNRFINNNGSERLRFALGHIFYFDSSQIGASSNPDPDTDVTGSAIVMETDFNYDNSLFFNNSIELSSSASEITRADSAIEYRFVTGQRVQLNYRFVEDTSAILQTNNDNINTTINQIGSKFSLPIDNQWEMGASYYYDLENETTQDGFIGIKYESCCWAVRLDYGYRLKNYDLNTNEATFDRGPTLMFELKGLGGIGSDMHNLGTSSLFTYGRPFQLRE